MAAVLHGSAVVTQDLDICAPMTPENFGRLISALKGLDPRNRMTPQRIPLPEHPDALRGFKNLYLITDAGPLDILGEIKGIGDYGAVSAHAITMATFGFPVRVLDLDTLILAKAAMGRSKDHRVIADLETIRQRLQQPPSS
jgi:hypothetical protein